MKHTRIVSSLAAISGEKRLNSRYIIGMLLPVFIFFINISAQAQCPAWTNTGDVGNASGYSAAITANGAGVPYVVFADINYSYNASVMKYNGSTWDIVGTPGFSAGSIVNSAAIAIDGSGTPYVAYQDGGNDGKITVMKYNGTAWVTVGSAGFSVGIANYVSLAIDGSGNPYVAYADNGDGDRPYVMKFFGGSWVMLGSPFLQTHSVANTSIAADASGTLYFACIDQSGPYGTIAQKYSGGSWAVLDTFAFSSYYYYSQITLDATGTPYVLCVDFSSFNSSVRKYNGTTWDQVGSTTFAAEVSYPHNIAVDNSGNVYMAYVNRDNDKATVVKYNGSSWLAVANSDFSTNTVVSAEVVIGASAVPYVFYQDPSGNNVAKLTSVIAPITGRDSVCTGDTAYLSCQSLAGTWSSSNIAVGTIDPVWGLLTSISSGTTTVSYTIGSCSVTHVVAVNSFSGAGIITGPDSACVFDPVSFYSSVPGGTWDAIGTGTFMLSGDTMTTEGFFAGTAIISYMVSTCMVTHNLFIKATDPGTIIGTLAVYTGQTITLSSTIIGGTWSSENPSVASIDAVTGVINGLAGAEVQIDYTVNGECGLNTASTIVTVMAHPDDGVINGVASVCLGGATVLSYSIAGGTWSSSNTSIATISPGTGIVTGITGGTTTITYTLPSSDIITREVTVIGSPDAGAITGASGVCLGATATLSDSAAGGIWVSSNTTVATIGSGNGIVTGVSLGSATISYSNGACFTTFDVTVEPGSVTITSPSNVVAGSSITFSSSFPTGTYTASNANAVVYGSDMIVGVSAGTVVVSYSVTNSCGALTASKTVTVDPRPCVSWYNVGSTGFTSDVAVWTKMKIDNSGTLYVSYVDVDSARCMVSKYNGSSWSTVGGAFSSPPNTNEPDFTLDGSGTPYLVFQDKEVGFKITAMKFNGTTWDTVGSRGFTTGDAQEPHIAIDGAGTPYVLFTEYIPPVEKASVKKFNGTSWVNVGTPGIGTGITNARSIVLDSSGTPYIVYDTYSGGYTVARFDGTNWVNVGDVYSVTTGAVEVKCTIDAGGMLYICFDDAANGHKITVMKYNGTIWQNIGAPGFSQGAVSDLNIIINGTVPYVGFKDFYNSGNATVMSYNGSSWQNVGPAGFSIGESYDLSMAINPAGIPYVAYYDYHNNSINSVMKLESAVPAITGADSVNAGSTITLADDATSGTWSSSNSLIATVGSLSGVVTGIDTGTVIITYTLAGGCNATKSITVKPVVGTPITGTAAVCVGSTTTLHNTTSSGTWTSSNTSVATIGSASGVVTGITGGTATITYTFPSSGTVTAVVSVNPLANAGTINGTATVCAGATTTLSDPTGGGAGSWSSGNTGIASVGTSGIVTGVAAGTATISYTVTNGCGSVSATDVVTVNPLANAGTITGTATVCAAATTTLSDATSGGVWTSSNTVIATVGTSGVVTGTASGNATISYTVTNGCGSASATDVVTVNPLANAGTITGTATVCTGAATTLSDATSGGVWTSSNTAKATVNSSGLVTGVAAGTATISYTVTNSCGAASATDVVTVNAAPSAGTIGGASSVIVGNTITLTDGVSGGAWTASNSNATVSSGGVVTGVTPGTVTISYTVANSCGSATATKVVSVNASLAPITGTFTLCPGTTSTLSDATTGGSWTSSNIFVATVGVSTGIVTGVAAGTVTITYSLAGSYVTVVATINPLPSVITGANTVCLNATTTLTNTTGGGTWSSSNMTIAGIDPSTGVVTGNTAGTATITYTLGTGCYKTMVMTVKPLPVAITGNLQLCPGGTTTLSDATPNGVSWVSSNTSVATIGSTSGVLAGVTTGTSTITYTINTGCSITAVVSVNSLPPAITGTASLCAGTTTSLSDATTGGTWSSSATSVATVGSGTGIVSGVNAGVANITYNAGAGCIATQAVTINALPNNITGTTTLCTGTTTALSDATTGGTWSSATTSVATIGSTGIVTGVASGTSVISYILGTGCVRTTSVTVSGSLASITGTPQTCIGLTTALADATPSGTWSSSMASVATVSSTGVVSGVAAGTTTITYALGTGCRAMLTVTINASVPAITGTASVCINATTALSDATGGGTWSSSNAALGTVDAATGIVTGIAAGTPTITYTLGSGCYRTLNVTVKALPGAISGNPALCTGGTNTFADGTGTSWTSSNTSVATIGSISGVATGIGAGTATITFTGTTGCIATKVLTVDVAPSITAISGASAVAVAHTTLFTDATPSGVWSSSNVSKATVSAGGIVTGVAAGAATISYTLTNGVCLLSVTHAITISSSRPGVAATEEDAADLFTVYPNPNMGSFTAKASGAGMFTVYSLEGKEIARYAIEQGDNSLALSKELAAGIYMCRYNGNDGSVVTVRLVYKP